MIIGIDASRANREYKTGTEWYSYHIIRWLAKIDDKNQYILYSDEPLVGGLLNLSENYKEKREGEPLLVDKNGYQEITSPYGNFQAKILKWPFNFFWTLGRLSLEMVFNPPEVLFVPAHTLPFFCPKKSVVTIHDVGFAREKNIYGPESMGPKNRKSKKMVDWLSRFFTFGRYGANTADYHYWSTRRALKNASRIITISEFSKKEIIDIFKNLCSCFFFLRRWRLEEKISVVYNGYNSSVYSEDQSEDKTKAVLEKYDIRRPFIFYIGRLEKKKNIPALIEAFSIFQGKNNQKYRLVLAGTANYGFDEVKYMIEQFDLGDKVNIIGWTPENDSALIMSAAEAFVFPTLYEGFGIPLLEAMAAGTPIAASNLEPIIEVAGWAAHLFDPRNTKDMADKISEIVNNKNLSSALVAAGRERARDFSWEKSARETLAILEKA